MRLTELRAGFIGSSRVRSIADGLEEPGDKVEALHRGLLVGDDHSLGSLGLSGHPTSRWR